MAGEIKPWFPADTSFETYMSIWDDTIKERRQKQVNVLCLGMCRRKESDRVRIEALEQRLIENFKVYTWSKEEGEEQENLENGANKKESGALGEFCVTLNRHGLLIALPLTFYLSITGTYLARRMLKHT
jgi:hypothetical protein